MPSETTTSTTEPSTTTSGPSTTTTLAPTTTTASSTTIPEDTNQLASGSGCTPGSETLPDGEWFGFVDDIGDTTLFFDLACWFTGDAAIIASAEDGEESPPPNDYYVRNQSDLIRELQVGPDVPVDFYPDGDPANYFVTTFAEWDSLADDRGGFFFGVWVTIEEGDVTRIVEQWVP